MSALKEYCSNVRAQYFDEFGRKPKPSPDLINLDREVQQRMMRCGVEANMLGVDPSNRDDLATLAYHTMMSDKIKNKRLNDLFDVCTYFHNEIDCNYDRND